MIEHKEYKELLETYMFSVAETNQCPPIMGFINVKGKLKLIPREIVNDMVDNKKAAPGRSIRKFLEKQVKKGNKSFTPTSFFFLSEVFYKENKSKEEYEKTLENYKKGLSEDPLAEEAIVVYTENKEGAITTIYPIYYDTKTKSRYASKAKEAGELVEYGSDRFKNMKKSSRMFAFFPRKV